ncbi:hypothetical protein OIO90_002024 [Microbotryomycetes sp. JL221]|nr:hypothetical protein OIO90_002024 [Microbotryomycetes sp. JL221]
MALIAYDNGLANGVDSQAASLGLQAIAAYLKTLLSTSSLLSRVPVSSRSSIDHDAQSLVNANEIGLTDSFAAFEMAPSLLAHSHVGVVERLFAHGPYPSSDDDDDDGEDDSSVGSTSSDEQTMASNVETDSHIRRSAGKQPKLSRTRTASVGRPSVRETISRTNSIGRLANTAGREQFVIDPSAVSIPQGHPDVPQTPFLPSSADEQSRPRVDADSNKPAQAMSLQQQLFPEIEADTKSVAPGELVPSVQSPGRHNNTSTDGASESEDGGASARAPVTRKKGEAQRKLWDVVDSVRLLDGVL